MATLNSMSHYVEKCKHIDPNVKVVVGNSRHLSFMCYSLRRQSDGSIHKNRPLHLYWRTFEGNTSHITSLNTFAKQYIYGVKIKELDSWWRLKLKSYKDRTMYLNKKSPHKIVWNCKQGNGPPEELPELYHAFVEDSSSMFKLVPETVTIVGMETERINP
jgi:hypothetical protein